MVVSSFAGSWSGLLGHPLDGEEVTRFAFLDDAGVDTKEPRFVVAGFVMHRDRQSAVIEDELYALATQVRPDKPNVVLSAKNIWSGTKEFDEDKHKLGMDRKALLLELAEMPRKFSLPVAFGHCVKANLYAIQHLRDTSRADMRIAEESRPHVVSQLACSEHIEGWMRSNASDEVAQLVHEDIPRSKKLLRQIHNYARDPLIGQAFGPKGMTPFTHIRGPIYFAEKHEERLLQLADACAYIICRYLNGYDDISDLFASLRPQIVAWADDDRETPHQPKTRRRHGGER